MLYNSMFFIQRICYLYDKTEYFNPWLQIIGLKIQRMTMEDYVIRFILIFIKF